MAAVSLFVLIVPVSFCPCDQKGKKIKKRNTKAKRTILYKLQAEMFAHKDKYYIQIVG